MQLTKLSFACKIVKYGIIIYTKVCKNQEAKFYEENEQETYYFNPCRSTLYVRGSKRRIFA